MTWIRKIINRLHEASTRPSAPASSMFGAEYQIADQQRERDLEMALAVEKERQRRGMAF